MKVLIVDDEQSSRELTTRLLQTYCPQAEIVACASSVEEGYKEILQHDPDLIFLDVQMQDGTGFDLLNRFQNLRSNIVFVTAHEQFAIFAFKRSAIDYILKPVSAPDIVNALKKAESRLNESEWNLQMKTLLHNTQESQVHRQKIILKTMERIYSIPSGEIIRLHSEGSYTEVFLKDGKRIVVSRQLKEFDELLSPSGFLRVHQSHLVNTDYIFCFEKSENQITMKDNSLVPVSTRKKDHLLEVLNAL